jgi:membrane-bound ClpP family serine protease
MTKYMWLSVALFAIGVTLLVIGIINRDNLGIGIGIAAMAAGALAFFTRREGPKQTPDDTDKEK